MDSVTGDSIPMPNSRRRQVLTEFDPEDEVWVATVPSLPGCLTQGNSQKEACRNAEDAISTWLAGAEAMGMAIPSEDQSGD